MMRTRILLADDHQIMRQGLIALLGKHPSMQVIAEAENGIQTLEIARREKPDVIIMDIAMPDINGIEVTRQLKAELADIKIIALSMHADRRFVTEILKAGASGYVLKQSAFEDLVTAIKAVMMNRKFLSADILDSVVDDYVSQLSKTDYEAYRQLSDRERQVLQLLAEGNSTKEIAYKLRVSVKTVESHRQNIMTKLGIHSLPGLTKFAIREGLTSLES
jgi:two-component system response regulator NreC